MRLFRRGERASTLDLLVAGLGNPGREYEQTRHNAGWMVVDELARRHDGSFRSKFDGRLSEIRLGELRLALLKPETYMNVSGKSIAAALGTQDFLRLRVGVGRPGRGDRRPVADYVLSAFEPELDVDALIARAADAVEAIAAEGLEPAQQRFN